MLIVYEKEENYFKKLEANTDKTNTRLFVSRVRNVDDGGLVSPTILVQAKIGEDVYMLRYTGDLPKFQFIPSFDAISNLILQEQAQKEYNDSYIAFEKKIDDEYTKMIALVTSIGYASIENAVIS